MSHKKKIELHVRGMTCGSCEFLTEHKNTFRDYLEIFAIMVILFDLYLLLKPLHLFDSGLGITANMSYGLIFLIGLVAAGSSCIAVTGGLLISLAAKYNESYQPTSRFEKFRPHLFFNIGRICAYAFFGGLLGALGSLFSISARATGFISIAASLFMILMGIKILKLFPTLSKFSLMMPKFISQKILNLERKQSKALPFTMGALTFFLPCGFTQALQLYVISRGSFIDGALTMLFFSLGTLPALLSLGAISSVAKGNFQKYFLKFSGVLVMTLGVLNISNGFTLAGIHLPSVRNQKVAQAETNSSVTVPIVNGKQVVEMKVDGYEYSPSQFTVLQGVPVEWRIDGTNAAGCGQVLSVPSLGTNELLPKENVKIITFTPKDTGDIPFNCSMGMMTRGASFHVISFPNSL